MTLTPNDLAALAILILMVIIMAHRDDPRLWQWIKDIWSDTVGAWCAKRRQQRIELGSYKLGWRNFRVR